jgi:predicted DsbA family dithiol-disulfide isomerase
MTRKRLAIDFVSDVVCPWCAIGLASLERALERVAGEIDVELRFQPFELNPQMGPEGEDIDEHLAKKYGSTQAQRDAARAALRERGAAVGFTFGTRSRTWNTFDAHRLLHWAGLEGRQRELKHALLNAYHGAGRNPSDPAVLADAAAAAGLDPTRAAAVLASGAYADDVRAAEREWQQMGIRAVPSIVIDRRHLVSGGQPAEIFEQALREIAAAG